MKREEKWKPEMQSVLHFSLSDMIGNLFICTTSDFIHLYLCRKQQHQNMMILQHGNMCIPYTSWEHGKRYDSIMILNSLRGLVTGLKKTANSGL